MNPQAIHLHPTAPLAERVLLPGDPGRALLLAQALLHEPKMFNHNRGLWGYTGTAADGELLTIQSTGMGGPSAAIVIAECHDLGARTLLRVGTCGGLDPGLELGQLLVVTEALAQDGTSRALGAGDRVPATPELVARLSAAAGPAATIGPGGVHRPVLRRAQRQRAALAGRRGLAVEMEAATLLALARRRGARAGVLLIVSDLLIPSRVRIEPEGLREAEHVSVEAAGGARR